MPRHPKQTIQFAAILRPRHALIPAIAMLAILAADVCFSQSSRSPVVRQKTSFSMVAFQDEPTAVPADKTPPNNQSNPKTNTSRAVPSEAPSENDEFLPEPIEDSNSVQPRQRRGQTSVLEEPLVIDSEPEPMAGEFEELACDELVGFHDGVNASEMLGNPASNRFPLSCPWQIRNVLDLRRYEFFAGTQAFSGPMNFQSNSTRTAAGGSFGLHQGFQWTSPMPWIFQGWFTGQFGLRATQNHFKDTPFSQEDRNQLFLTVGAFRRVDYGLQGGLVVDYLKEHWYYRSSLTQLRGELSFRTLAGSEFGFAFATGIEDKEIQETFDSGVPTTLNTNISPIDTFRFFYRFHPLGSKRSTFMLATGFTDDQNFLAEGALETALTHQLGLRLNSLYVLPNSNIAANSYEQESWAMGVSIVYTPRRGFTSGSGYERAMMSVADNSSFLVGRVP